MVRNIICLSSADSYLYSYCDRDKRKVFYVLFGSLLCVMIIGAAFGIPIALTSVLSKTTTTETVTTVSTAGKIVDY